MSKLPWEPWHHVVKLRDDLKQGDLPMSAFAADLYLVSTNQAPRVYQEPADFFALTYPTYNLRRLAADVVNRLAGKSEKAVRQLELTYGGGKTHTLVTLYHLVKDPSRLPALSAVDQFIKDIGAIPEKAEVAVLAFDRLDPVVGMDVLGPNGEKGRFRYPWSALAWQLAGPEGLAMLGQEGETEREEHPFTNVLADILAAPAARGRSSLVLLDEVLMWARTKVGADAAWRPRIQDFFQCLTQAAVQVKGCCLVASLLATDPKKSDPLGREILRDLHEVFRREREEGVQPVEKADVPEVLRRRFFKPDTIRDREAFRPHVVAALKGIADLDEQTRKEGKTAEDRLVDAYPFHPDLIEILYGKWTNLESFQRTRGVLRTFALALREAERHDRSPLVGPNAFLGPAGKPELSEAARDLASVAAAEEATGKQQDWPRILEIELGKAQKIQDEYPGLRFRELEQSVIATFLHSQPIGHKALPRELFSLVGPTRPDRIDLEKSLRRWADVSWYLDEATIHDVEVTSDGNRQLPRAWRLGTNPNLNQMHDSAFKSISDDIVKTRLIDEISKLKSLTAGASAAGAAVHVLPVQPSKVDDDGAFHYVTLGPSAASDSGKPSAEARRYLDERSGPEHPRVFRNAILAAVPARDGLEAAKAAIQDYLAWEVVKSQLDTDNQELDPLRAAGLATSLRKAREAVPGAIQQAYCIVVTVSEKDEAQAFRLAVTDKPLFQQIKEDRRARIQDRAISADALLPGGPYALWREGDTSRRLKNLCEAFAQLPRLPKMLDTRAVLDTLIAGCKDGQFVLRQERPDRSIRTFWREEPDPAALEDPTLEVVLPEAAEITSLNPALLPPGALPGLWTGSSLSPQDLCVYFSGTHSVTIAREGYDEAIAVPKAARSVVEAAVLEAVQVGKLWLLSATVSLISEEVPAGILTDAAILQAPPPPIAPTSLLPDALASAWSGASTTGLALAEGLSAKGGKALPWALVKKAIADALRVRLLELGTGSGPWPCDLSGARHLALQVPAPDDLGPRVPPPPSAAGKRHAAVEADLTAAEIQDLADAVGEVKKAAAGYDLKFRLRIEVGTEDEPPSSVLKAINETLQEVSPALQFEVGAAQEESPVA